MRCDRGTTERVSLLVVRDDLIVRRLVTQRRINKARLDCAELILGDRRGGAGQFGRIPRGKCLVFRRSGGIELHIGLHDEKFAGEDRLELAGVVWSCPHAGHHRLQPPLVGPVATAS